MEKLVETLGITRLSKSQVSTMAAELDAQVADFRTRPLDQSPYTFLAADALVLKVREGGRVVNVHGPAGHRRERRRAPRDPRATSTSAEDGAGWLAFFVSWSPPTRTTGWSPRSVRRCPVPRCRDAEPSTRRT
jgi:transposase-like protein